MLKKLAIHNLAIIENSEVTFEDGFTVLTGETGAGKSLVIDSLSLLLGARASSELIRAGEEKATITGIFTSDNPRVLATLQRLNIPEKEEGTLIERSIGKSKNVIKVNGIPVSLTELSAITKNLADIHDQFDFAKILNPENYLEIIDGLSFDLLSSLKKDYVNSLEDYRKKKVEYETLLDKQRKIEESRDFYEFQYKELCDADLKEGEEEAMASEIALLRNYDKVFSLAQEADEIAHEDFLDRLYELNKRLDKLSDYQPEYKEMHDRLDDRYYEIRDTLDELKKKIRNMDYDPERLNELEQRDSDLSALKRKYRKSIDELISYRDSLAESFGKGANIEEAIQAALAAKEQAFQETLSRGQDLSNARQKVARSIEKEIIRHLSDLQLRSNFSVTFFPMDSSSGDAIFRGDGIDLVDFLIETNVGEGLRSLSKVISGGEASRIMLAFKALFIKANKVSTVIFDEIDTGISGEAAAKMARKIQEISLSTQVIAITHLPQVASLSDHHILISKEVKNGRTYSHIKKLSLEEKIDQVAYLISGGKVTEKQKETAQEMILAK